MPHSAHRHGLLRGRGPGVSLCLAFAAAACLTGSYFASAQSNDRQRTQSKARRVNERMQQLQREADSLAAQSRTLLGELRQLEVQRELKSEELASIDRDLTAVRKELKTTAGKVDELEKIVLAGRPGVHERLISLYKRGRAGYLKLLLQVENLRQLGRAYRMVAELAELDRRRIDEYKTSLETLKTARTALQDRTRTMTGLQEEARQARAAVDRAVEAHAALIRSIDARRDLAAQLAGELQNAQRQLQSSLSGISGPGSTTNDVIVPLTPFRGTLEWPVAGKVTARFGRESTNQFGTTIVRNGIDIASPEGTAVAVVHEGKVAFADGFAGFGDLVILDHGNQTYSLYGYLGSLQVTKGMSLERQDVVGTVGRSPGGIPALYFELRIDGSPVDPLQWLKPF